ncbi:MAG: ATP-binding cassette domain-containing protein [Bradymonadia bacterium]|jgi:ABC-2 type transport system ATP-binding protein
MMCSVRVEAAVRLSDVVKILGGVKRTDQLSLSAYPGRIYGLIGPNGAGKTTLLNLITGLYKPDRGTVRVSGLDPVRDYRRVRRSIGLLPQDTALYPELSARENLRFHASLYLASQRGAKARIDEILNLVDLSDRANELVRNFSGGMSRRLGIGRALLNDPEILLLDEPTLGVDVQSTHKIWEYIRSQREYHKTIFVTTNIMGEAEALCDEVIILDRGQKIASGSPEELKASLRAATISVLPKGGEFPDSALLRERLGAYVLEHGAIKIPAPRGDVDLVEVLGKLSGILEIESISLQKPTLDDVFLTLTGKSLRD